MFEGQETLTEADALHPAVREAGVGEAPIEQDGPLYRSRPRACAQTLTTCAISLSGFAQAATQEVNIEHWRTASKARIGTRRAAVGAR
jgi:hypothetical protein